MKYPLKVLLEAQVQQAVRLVHDEDLKSGGILAVNIGRSEKLDESSRCSDEEVRRVPHEEREVLRWGRRPPDKELRHHRRRRRFRPLFFFFQVGEKFGGRLVEGEQGHEDGMDLRGELARGAHDDGGDVVALQIFNREDLLDCWYEE